MNQTDKTLLGRFEIIFGNLQFDNQLPLTLMPVLLAPEQTTDINHPAFRMTIEMQNENIVGIRVFPYICVQVMYDFNI